MLIDLPDDVLTTEQAAEMIGLSPVTLTIWRGQGKGPSYLKTTTNRIFYLPKDLEPFAKGRALRAGVKAERVVPGDRNPEAGRALKVQPSA